MSESANVIEAVTAECPIAEYQRLGKTSELTWDAELGLWVVMGAARIREVLEHADLAVRPPGEPVPRPLAGKDAGEIYAAFARMSEGAEHRRRKEAVIEALEGITMDRAARATRTVLRRREEALTLHQLQFHVPVMAVGEILGIASEHWDDLMAWTSTFVRAAVPGVSETDVRAGNDAASRLTSLLAEAVVFSSPAGASLTRTERIANAIGLVFQTHDATAGLIGNLVLALAENPGRSWENLIRDVVRNDPPVHNTRRYAMRDLDIGGIRLRKGDAVLVVLASGATAESEGSLAFGYGRHRCPGEHIALAIAKEVVDDIQRTRAIPAGHPGAITMHRSGNVRIPDFRGGTESTEAT